MPKVKKRKHAVSSHVTLSQALHIYKPVNRTRKNKISFVDEQLMHAAFFIRHDLAWELTSNCNIYAKDSSSFYVGVLRRTRPHDKKGQRKVTQQYSTVIKSENDVFAFRYSLESKKCKIKLDEYKDGLFLAGDGSMTKHILTTVVPSQHKRNITPARLRNYAMSGSHNLNQLANLSRNPNNCPNKTDFLHHEDIVNACVRKIQSCVREREIQRGAKRMRETINEQAYCISLVKYLSEYISNDKCEMLLIGSDDTEICTTFSPYDKHNATSKARHVIDALCATIEAKENKIPITWIKCCEIAVVKITTQLNEHAQFVRPN